MDSSYQQVQQPSFPSPTTINMLTTVDGSKPVLNKTCIELSSCILLCTSFWIRKKFNFRPLQSKQTESCYVGFVSRTDAEACAHVAEEEGM